MKKRPVQMEGLTFSSPAYVCVCILNLLPRECKEGGGAGNFSQTNMREIIKHFRVYVNRMSPCSPRPAKCLRTNFSPITKYIPNLKMDTTDNTETFVRGHLRLQPYRIRIRLGAYLYRYIYLYRRYSIYTVIRYKNTE